MKCKYGHLSPDGARYCITCGVGLFEDKAEKNQAVTNIDKKSNLNKSTNRAAIFIGFISLMLVAYGLTSQRSDNALTQIQTDYRNLLKDGVDLEAAQLAICENLKTSANSLHESNLALIKKINDNEGATYDGRIAQKFIEEAGISFSEDYSEKFDMEIENIVINKLRSNFKDELPEELKSMLTNDSIVLCEKQVDWMSSVNIIDQQSTANELDTLVDIVLANAQSVPWYPEDFQEFSTGIAFRYLSSNEFSCDYSFGTCSSIDVISKFTCDTGLYAESNLMDSSGTVVDWSNDTLPFLAAGQIANLKFSYGVSVNNGTVMVTNIECY